MCRTRPHPSSLFLPVLTLFHINSSLSEIQQVNYSPCVAGPLLTRHILAVGGRRRLPPTTGAAGSMRYQPAACESSQRLKSRKGKIVRRSQGKRQEQEIICDDTTVRVTEPRVPRVNQLIEYIYSNVHLTRKELELDDDNELLLAAGYDSREDCRILNDAGSR